MQNKKQLLAITILILAAGVAIWNWHIVSLPSPSARLAAEKEIYTLLLTEFYSTDGVPLAEYTTVGFLGYDGISQEDFSEWDTANPKLKKSTFANFVELNQQSYSIREYLPSDISDHMTGQHGWWVSVSRIGFDSQLTQALVVIEQNMGCDRDGVCCNDDGGVYFLQKLEGHWVIADVLTHWMGECGASDRKTPNTASRTLSRALRCEHRDDMYLTLGRAPRPGWWDCSFAACARPAGSQALCVASSCFR